MMLKQMFLSLGPMVPNSMQLVINCLIIWFRIVKLWRKVVRNYSHLFIPFLSFTSSLSFTFPGKFIQLTADGKRQSMLFLPGVLEPRPPSGKHDWVVWAFQQRAQVERGEMEGIIGHRYPIMWLEGVPLALNDGPAWGMRASLCFMCDDKLFCWRIMVNVIMSNDGEPQKDSQSQAVKFLLKNWTQFMGLDCDTFIW